MSEPDLTITGSFGPADVKNDATAARTANVNTLTPLQAGNIAARTNATNAKVAADEAKRIAAQKSGEEQLQSGRLKARNDLISALQTIEEMRRTLAQGGATGARGVLTSWLPESSANKLRLLQKKLDGAQFFATTNANKNDKGQLGIGRVLASEVPFFTKARGNLSQSLSKEDYLSTLNNVEDSLRRGFAKVNGDDGAGVGLSSADPNVRQQTRDKYGIRTSYLPGYTSPDNAKPDVSVTQGGLVSAAPPAVALQAGSKEASGASIDPDYQAAHAKYMAEHAAKGGQMDPEAYAQFRAGWDKVKGYDVSPAQLDAYRKFIAEQVNPNLVRGEQDVNVRIPDMTRPATEAEMANAAAGGPSEYAKQTMGFAAGVANAPFANLLPTDSYRAKLVQASEAAPVASTAGTMAAETAMMAAAPEALAARPVALMTGLGGVQGYGANPDDRVAGTIEGALGGAVGGAAGNAIGSLATGLRNIPAGAGEVYAGGVPLTLGTATQNGLKSFEQGLAKVPLIGAGVRAMQRDANDAFAAKLADTAATHDQNLIDLNTKYRDLARQAPVDAEAAKAALLARHADDKMLLDAAHAPQAQGVAEHYGDLESKGLTGFNTSAHGSALSHVGAENHGLTGEAGAAATQNAIDNAYAKAFEGVTVPKTPDFLKTVADAQEAIRATDPGAANALEKQLNPFLAFEGDLSGDDLHTLLQRTRKISNTARNAEGVGWFNNVSPHVDNINAAVDKLLADHGYTNVLPAKIAADKAFRNAGVINDAVNAANKRDPLANGLFTPEDLHAAAAKNVAQYEGGTQLAIGANRAGQRFPLLDLSKSGVEEARALAAKRAVAEGDLQSIYAKNLADVQARHDAELQAHAAATRTASDTLGDESRNVVSGLTKSNADEMASLQALGAKYAPSPTTPTMGGLAKGAAIPGLLTIADLAHAYSTETPQTGGKNEQTDTADKAVRDVGLSLFLAGATRGLYSKPVQGALVKRLLSQSTKEPSNAVAKFLLAKKYLYTPAFLAGELAKPMSASDKRPYTNYDEVLPLVSSGNMPKFLPPPDTSGVTLDPSAMSDISLPEDTVGQ